MKVEIICLLVTAFILANIYYDNKYYNLFLSYKKYLQMAFVAFCGMVIYFLLKKNPAQCKKILYQANNLVKYMPIDKSSMDMLSPIIDFTSENNYLAKSTNPGCRYKKF